MIKKSRGLHGLKGTMLADPDLEAIDKLGVRNYGINVRPPGVKGLPIPTTLMVDETGIVRWMDQSEHYFQRSDPAVVRDALATAS